MPTSSFQEQDRIPLMEKMQKPLDRKKSQQCHFGNIRLRAKYCLVGICIMATAPVRAQELRPAKIPNSMAVNETVTLDDAVRAALISNALIKNDELDISISQERRAIVRTDYLPAVHVQSLGGQLLTPLNFSFDKGVFGNFKSTGPIPAENLNVSTTEKPFLFVNTAITQPITQIPRISLASQAQSLATEIARSKLKQRQLEIVCQVRRAYYQALEATAALETIESTNALLHETERITNNYLAHETVLPADGLEVKQQAANAQLELLKAENSLMSAKEQLNHLMGRDVRRQFSLVALADALPPDIDLPAAQERALAARADLRQNEKQEQQKNLERRIKKLEMLPDVTFVVDYLSMFGTEVLPKNVVVAGLFLNWQPIDYGKKHHEILLERQTIRQIQNSHSDLQATILLEVGTAVRNLKQAKQQLEVSKISKDLALEHARVAANKYKVEAVLLQEVLKTQKELAQANSQYNQALSALWTARADIEKALGEG